MERGEEVPGKAGMALSACGRRRVWCGSSQVDECEIRFESRSLASWTRLFDGGAARCGLTGDSSSIVDPGGDTWIVATGPHGVLELQWRGDAFPDVKLQGNPRCGSTNMAHGLVRKQTQT